MSPLAVVLAPILFALPPSAAPPQPPGIERQLAPHACADIDPHISLYVPPPAGRGPLRLISQTPRALIEPQFEPSDLDFGPAAKGRGPLVVPPLACPRLIPVDDAR